MHSIKLTKVINVLALNSIILFFYSLLDDLLKMVIMGVETDMC